MAKTRFAHGRGSVAEVVLVLFLVLVFVSLVVRPWHEPDRARRAIQVAQLRSLEAALELFASEFGIYPLSDANDSVGQAYCGAMTMTEAITGKDLLGFHLRSVFRADGLDPIGGTLLYPKEPDPANLKARKGPYVQPESSNAYRLVDIYGKGNTGPFREDLYVLCDTFERKQRGGAKIGMPILYYRANPNGTAHDVNDPNNPANIYDYRDNQALLGLGVPGHAEGTHPLMDAKRFYLNTRSDKVATESRPYRADSYILISAGKDGLYGSADDICNFAWKYREQ